MNTLYHYRATWRWRSIAARINVISRRLAFRGNNFGLDQYGTDMIRSWVYPAQLHTKTLAVMIKHAGSRSWDNHKSCMLSIAHPIQRAWCGLWHDGALINPVPRPRSRSEGCMSCILVCRYACHKLQWRRLLIIVTNKQTVCQISGYLNPKPTDMDHYSYFFLSLQQSWGEGWCPCIRATHNIGLVSHIILFSETCRFNWGPLMRCSCYTFCQTVALL